MIKLQILRVFPRTSFCGAVDKVSSHHAVGHAFESRSEPLFLLKYLLIGGVDVCPPHAQTVSTSLMPRLVNKFFSKLCESLGF